MALRDSQDVTLALAGNPGTPRDSQDVILVLTKTVVSGTISDSQAAQSLAVSGVEENTIGTVQASQTLAASGAQIIHLRDSQDVVLALAQNPGKPRNSQDVILVLARTGFIGSTTQSPQTLAATGTQQVKPPLQVGSHQLHPVLKPLDFLSRPLKQAGRRAAIFTTMLTAAGASRAFSMPMGGRNLPVAGRVFSFTMGGSVALGSVGGTLIITPFYGATADGVNLGQSAAHSYAANYARVTQWRLKGEILFQRVDLTPGLSLVVCSGVFVMGGDPTNPGSELTILFGSASPVTVDTGSVAPSASGALNFAATFAPLSMNAVKPAVSVKYAFLRS